MLDNFASLNVQSNPNEIVKDTVYTLLNTSGVSINVSGFSIEAGSSFLIIDTTNNKVGDETDDFQNKVNDGTVDPYLVSGDLVFQIDGVSKTKYEFYEFYNQYIPAYEKTTLAGDLYFKESDLDVELLKSNALTLGNEIVINSKSDLPDPVGGVITLSDNDKVYRASSLVNLDSDRIVVTGTGVVFHGNNTSSSGFITNTTGVAITCTNTFSVQNMAIIAPSSSKIIDAVGSGSEVMFLSESIFMGGTQQIECTDYDVFITRFCRYLNGGNCILFNGSFNNILVDKNIFRGILLKIVDFNGCNVDSVSVNVNTPILEATSTFLTIDVNSANINLEGTITGNKVDETLGGTSIVGYSPFDIKWEVSGNNTILISDRLQPTGWGVYFDDNSSTQTFNNTPSVFEVNGLGGETNETRLPKSIRGVSSLWDSVNNEICPVTNGDSGNIRLSMDTVNLDSNPTRIDFILDISGNATPDTPVFTVSHTLKNDNTQPIGIPIPFFVLDTFLANKGQIFVSVNSGTVEVTNKQIFIQRVSSGAL